MSKEDDLDEKIIKEAKNYEEIFQYIQEDDLNILISSIRKTIKSVMFDLEKSEEDAIQFIATLTYDNLLDIVEDSHPDNEEEEEENEQDYKEKNKNNIN